ncbi:MAG TPA: phasin family protein [Xanthobacteraceae bacterium]|nr:phasin family protein [Xanthobacteraceae bacterium]
MAQIESRVRQPGRSSPPNLPFGDLSTLHTRRVNEYLTAQSEMVKMFEGMNRRWVDRMKSEANLASDFAAKLAAVRTFPDAMRICQEWSTRRLELMAEDGKHLLDDSQKFVEAEARLLSNRWPGGGE